MRNEIIINREDLCKYLDFKNLGSHGYEPYYTEKVKELPESIKVINSSDAKFLPQNIPEELLLGLFIRNCKKYQSQFVIDNDAIPAYKKVIMYLREDPEFLTLNPGFSFKKGLLIRGKVGCGKTLLFKGLLETLNQLSMNSRSHLDSFYSVESNRIALDYALAGANIFNQHSDFNNEESYGYVDGTLFIDDLGAEPITSHFKSQLNSVGELIQIRYNLEYITHATTNLDAKSLKEFYGERVFSRIKEMFNDITMDGQDRRI
jgi:hypothetical protein